MMNYQEMKIVPAWEPVREAEGKIAPASAGKVLWADKNGAPPLVGEQIIASINNCGPAIVTGYFVQEGFLGVLCRLLAPPAWHIKQNKGNPKGHLFGTEWRPEPIASDAAERAAERRALGGEA